MVFRRTNKKKNIRKERTLQKTNDPVRCDPCRCEGRRFWLRIIREKHQIWGYLHGGSYECVTTRLCIREENVLCYGDTNDRKDEL